MTPILEFHEVEKNYGTQQVLPGIDFSLSGGEVLAIGGPSGAGKTTLLRLAAELEKPSSGHINRTGGSVGYVFQEPRLLPWATAWRNVAVVLEAQRIAASEAEERARQLLGRVGLMDAADMLPRQLSGGMAQRVSIARALAVDPVLLLLDEPFSGLDDRLRNEIGECLRLYIRSHVPAVLCVTHHPDEIASLATRTLTLEGKSVQ